MDLHSWVALPLSFLRLIPGVGVRLVDGRRLAAVNQDPGQAGVGHAGLLALVSHPNQLVGEV